METEPLILILEDEETQLLVLRSTLSGIGVLHEYTDPETALAFLRTTRADAAIIDVHMPLSTSNGMDFMKAVRKFDRDLCIIVRTGDTSPEVADTAIEVRAYRRAIKGKVSVSEMRQLTLAAIKETREKRRLKSDADSSSEVRTELAKILGSVEDELSVSECYKGLLNSMRNQLTAISAVSEVLMSALDKKNLALVAEYVRKNRTLSTRLVGEINGFLEGPYAETWSAPRENAKARINSVIEAIQKRFDAVSDWTAQGIVVKTGGLQEDRFVNIEPLRLITALRHLIEFCLLRSQPETTARLTTSCIENPVAEIEQGAAPKLVFNRSSLRADISYIEFRLCAFLGATRLEEIRQAFHEASADPRTGNLQMLNLALGEAQTAIAVHQKLRGEFAFALYIPVTR